MCKELELTPVSSDDLNRELPDPNIPPQILHNKEYFFAPIINVQANHENVEGNSDFDLKKNYEFILKSRYSYDEESDSDLADCLNTNLKNN